MVRVVGDDRYETAALLALENYEPGLETVFLASGRDFPDALAGAALAGAESVPVLLTRPDGLPGATSAALSELRPGQVIVLGGDTAVGQTVLDQLTGLDLAHARVSGTNRYGTAAKISALMEPADIVFIATGLDYPDALAGSAAAGKLKAPVLLSRHQSLPGAAVAELVRHDPQRVLVLGGETAVADDVLTQIEALGYPVERVRGTNRYGTAAAVAELWTEGAHETWVSTGRNYADALAASALAARQDGPVLLTAPTSLPDPTGEALVALGPETVHILGGEVAVNDTVMAQIRDLPWE